MISTSILQGTDGIRGMVSYDEPRDHNQNALAFFLASGVLTPSFFEHYTYAYASLLLETGSAEKGDSIVIGWDPRDSTGDFNRSAVLGIRKAGLKAITVGVLPTPAIPLFMLKVKASGGVVLTASHNPSDQNGIKLFHGWTALKFLPADDTVLSEKIFDQQDIDLNKLSVSGGYEDQSDVARSFFIRYQTDPRNSWIEKETFEDQILVIDASKGAVAAVVEDIFSQYRFKEIIYTNLEGGINESCGVADLEGQELIQENEIADVNGRFYRYQTLRVMMETARSQLEIQNGELKLSGLVFDGDGDRCFRLDYDPGNNTVIISSGDQLGIHLARYISDRDSPEAGKTWFINTVESDLKTAITAEEEGYKPVITGVGDKWILKKAVLDMIQSQLPVESPQADVLKDILDKEEAGEDLSGIDISKAWKACINAGVVDSSNAKYSFQVGIEESGHSIIPGYIDTGTETLRCFAGNGIKSGLNALVAIQWGVKSQTEKERINYLQKPFQAGVKKTYYTYYVNKSNLMPGTVFRQELEEAVRQAVGKYFQASFHSEQIRFAEEVGLIYFRISKEGKTVGAVFVRNSGTEDKSALYLRGDVELSSFLERIGQQLHLFLLKGLKKIKNEFFQLEKQILKMVAEGDSPEALREANPTLPYIRVLKEIEFKEGLVKRDGPHLKLTEKGKLLNDYWEAPVKS